MAGFKFPSFKEHPAKAEARQLLATVTIAARDPSLYGPEKAPDTFDGRFQVLTLFGVLALRRLGAAPDQAELAQAFTDLLFLSFDDGLREAGVGDLSVPKHMKKIGQAFYGRYTAYDAVLSAGDQPGLAAALSRNIWDAEQANFAPALARRVAVLAAGLDAAPPASIAATEHWVSG